jgi:hypothetical protein
MSPTSGLGGSGGGGTGNQSNEGNGGAATANTGGGGGGSQDKDVSQTRKAGGNGGSGIVIIRFPTTFGTLAVGAGLTYTSATDGSDTVVTFTAGEDSISWS